MLAFKGEVTVNEPPPLGAHASGKNRWSVLTVCVVDDRRTNVNRATSPVVAIENGAL